MDEIYVTSDTHLDHANIIKYSKRPFANVVEMNNKIIDNWNKIVDDDDIVYFLGDFSMGRNTRSFLDRIRGNVVFIEGNHDKDLRRYVDLHGYIIKVVDGVEFYMVHRPEDIPRMYDGWVICGHHHNNFPDTFPFFNPKIGVINVGVDVTNFMPVNIKDIIDLVKSHDTKLSFAPQSEQNKWRKTNDNENQNPRVHRSRGTEV